MARVNRASTLLRDLGVATAGLAGGRQGRYLLSISIVEM